MLVYVGQVSCQDPGAADSRLVKQVLCQAPLWLYGRVMKLRERERTCSIDFKRLLSAKEKGRGEVLSLRREG